MEYCISEFKWVQPLMDKGLVPLNCRRIVIDIPADGAIKVYYETFAARQVLDVCIEEVMKGDIKAQAIEKTDPLEGYVEITTMGEASKGRKVFVKVGTGASPE